MKVSKLNHTRLSVSNTVKAKDIKGQLYPNPIPKKYKEGKTVDFVRHAIGQIKKSGLYSIFTPCPAEADEQEAFAYGKIKSNAKEITELLMKSYDRDTTEARLLAKVAALKQHHFSSEVCVSDSSDFSAEQYVNFCVDHCLKKSLRKVIIEEKEQTKYYLPALIKELLLITCVSDGYKERISAYPNDKLLLVIKYLDEDVNKKNQLTQIKNSIDNQNVKVQVFCNGKENVLKLSSSEKEKQAPLFRFLVSYSASDIQERNLLLAKLRGYITLFVTGNSTYQEEADRIKSYEFQDDKFMVPHMQYLAQLPDHSIDFSIEAGEIISSIYQIEAEMEVTREQIDKDSDKKAKEAVKKELDKKKRELIFLKNEYKKIIKDKLWLNFRNAKSSLGDDQDGRFWVTYVLDEADKILSGKSINEKKNGQAYLINTIWKDMVAYIGTKYIDMGKAVYHFAMPEDISDLENNHIFGKVRQEYASGITSFDYEMIKASETIQREVAMYLTFAIHNFVRNTVTPDYRMRDGNEDILLNRDDAGIELYHDMKRRYLQFFGGQSRWYESPVIQEKDIDIFRITADLLYNLRNENFHYTGKIRTEDFHGIEILQRMFEYEIRKSGNNFRKKYYSNNVLMFYPEENVTGLMNHLYDKSKYIPAQIPSFSNILSRINIDNFLKGYIEKSGIEKIAPEEMMKYHNAIYFVLKEIYYYGFLQQDDLVERFIIAMEKYKTDHDKKWNEKAYEHFMNRVHEIVQSKATNAVFYDMCQKLITDFEQQNTDYRVRTSKTSDKDIYQHYKMLLYLGIRNAFKEYLQSKNYDFLKKPVYDNQRFKSIDEETFCNSWQGHLYDELLELKENNFLLSWYVLAHFLDAKQINHLMGDFKNYIAFTEDIIKRRESLTGKKQDTTALTRKNDLYRNVVSMLGFVQKQVNVFTNHMEDYFENEEEYANVLSYYFDFDSSKNGSKELYDFCKKTVEKGSPTGTVGLFYDQENLILNRNVIMASMYGNHDILSHNIEKITYKEICDYYSQIDSLKEIFQRNYCETKEEQKDLRNYQNEKNRIELTDILIYSEIINECLSKLISWAYLRERDLMYFQLGMQYIKLYHTANVAENETWLRSIVDDRISIQDGAVLYEIVAMNDYDMAFIKRKSKGKGGIEIKSSVKIVTKVGMFAGIYGEKVYAEGLEFFENYNKDHDEVVDFRNYIDHFKYFANTQRSILELYGDAYDRLFDYNHNFRKSVIYVLENTLLRYFAIGHIGIAKEEDAYQYRKKGNTTRKSAKLELKPFGDKLLISDHMKYTYIDQTKGKKMDVNVPARSDLFMKQLAAILQYHR